MGFKVNLLAVTKATTQSPQTAAQSPQTWEPIATI
jgi:hypothetical protein